MAEIAELHRRDGEGESARRGLDAGPAPAAEICHNRAPRSEEGDMSWHLKGSYAETCSCDLMCPCNLSFDHGATYDYCRATLAFNIREGNVEGTDVAGGNVVIIFDSPKVLTEGNWKVGVFIDEAATDEQFQSLAEVFCVSFGGPMACLEPLIGELVGPERA